jgi:integrase
VPEDEAPLVAALSTAVNAAQATGKTEIEAEPGCALTLQRLYDIARWAFERAAQAAGKPEAAHRLWQASIHWLRHTIGTRLLLANVGVGTIMMEMGHSDIRTSMQYIRADHAARFEQVDRAFE